MPLTSKSRVYKHLPLDIAERITHQANVKKNDTTRNTNVKKDGTTRNEIRKECITCPANTAEEDGFSKGISKRKDKLKKKHDPGSDTCSSSEEPSINKRPKTPQSSRSNDSETPTTPSVLSNESFTPRTPDDLEFHPSFTPIRPPSVMDVDNVTPLTSRPRLQRCESRTTTSLDIVEMWESDSELEIGQNEDKFDRINGVLINPRKTFDFSELRSVHETKSTKTKSPRLVQTLPVSGNTSLSFANPKFLSQKPTPRILKSSRAPNLPLSLPKPKPEKKASTKQTTTSTENCEKTSKISTNLPKIFLNNKNSIKLSGTSSNTVTENSAFDTYRPRPMTPRSRSPSRHPRTKPPSGGTLSLAISQRRDSNRMETDSDTSRPSSPLKLDRTMTVAEKKVKFNNEVNITDGENSMIDVLRRSSKNSANLIKQKHLQTAAWRAESPISREGSPEYWGMVC